LNLLPGEEQPDVSAAEIGEASETAAPGGDVDTERELSRLTLTEPEIAEAMRYLMQNLKDREPFLVRDKMENSADVTFRTLTGNVTLTVGRERNAHGDLMNSYYIRQYSTLDADSIYLERHMSRDNLVTLVKRHVAHHIDQNTAQTGRDNKATRIGVDSYTSPGRLWQLSLPTTELALRSLKNQRLAITEEIADRASDANNVGREIPTHQDTRYRLRFFDEFFANGDFDDLKAQYGDRFDFGDNKIAISGFKHKEYIDHILEISKGEEEKTVALVSHRTPEAELNRLTQAGIRFIPVNVQVLADMRAKRDDYRAQFQIETFCTMWLARHVKDNRWDSAANRVLSFYLSSHFSLDGITPSEYIEAIISGNAAKLIQGYLLYRPVELYNARKDYEKIAPALLSA